MATLLKILEELAPEKAITDSEYDYCVHCGADMLGGSGERKPHKRNCPWVFARKIIDNIKGKAVLPRAYYKGHGCSVVKEGLKLESGYANKKSIAIVLDNGKFLQVPEWRLFGGIDYDDDY